MFKYFKIITLVLLTIVLSSSLVFAYHDRVEIISLKGNVKIIPKGRTNWIRAKIGMILTEGDQIKTERRSRCDLSFDAKKKNIIGIMENSDVIILLDENQKIEIVEASLYAKLADIPLGSRFELKTPTAVCGARGTGLGVNTNKEKTEATAYVNSIYVTNANKETEDIREGFKRNVDKYGKISKEIAAKVEDIEKFNSWRSNIDKILKSGVFKKKVIGIVEKMNKDQEKKDDKVIDLHEQKSGRLSEGADKQP